MRNYHTEQRSRLRGLFEESPHRYFTARELADLIGDSISLSAVYRNLDAMAAAGLVCAEATPGEMTRRYRLASHPDCSRHVHFACTRCGRLTHLSDKQTNGIRRALASTGLQLDLAKTVLSGLCADCREGA